MYQNHHHSRVQLLYVALAQSTGMYGRLTIKFCIKPYRLLLDVFFVVMDFITLYLSLLQSRSFWNWSAIRQSGFHHHPTQQCVFLWYQLFYNLVQAGQGVFHHDSDPNQYLCEYAIPSILTFMALLLTNHSSCFYPQSNNYEAARDDENLVYCRSATDMMVRTVMVVL